MPQEVFRLTIAILHSRIFKAHRDLAAWAHFLSMLQGGRQVTKPDATALPERIAVRRLHRKWSRWELMNQDWFGFIVALKKHLHNCRSPTPR